MPTLTDIQRALRDHVRFTGDGLPGEPVGAPLPVGSPRSGEHNPTKKELRDILIAVFSESGAGASGIAQEALETANAASSTANSINALASRADQSAGPGIGQYASLAAAVADNPGGTIRINYDPDAIPADYRGVGLDYITRSRNRNFAQTAFSTNQSQRILRTAAGEHAGRTESAFHTEMLAWGSGQNGPASATIGNSIYITKRGYAGGSAAGGEIDALEIFVRQDGPDGLPNGDPGSSDASGLMINVQNIGTCGFIAVMDCSVSNILRTPGFPIDISMQVQAGVITANAASGKKDVYGFAAVMRQGQGLTAFQAGADATDSAWENVIDSPAWRVNWAGAVQFKSGSYADFGGQILRGTGLNGQMLIANKGTTGVAISAIDTAPITFLTGNVARWQVAGGGALVPATDLGAGLGDASRRLSIAHLQALVLYGNSLTAAGLPTYADNAAALAGGLTAGRVYRTASGELRIVT